MIRVGLVGVTGYTGMELARLLTGHPNMKLTAATSRTEAGKRLGDLYPFLNGLPGADVILIEPEPELIAKECDLAFLAVPHTAATEMAAALVERGLKVVDLSADFRLRDPATYAAWYKREHVCTDLLHKAVYGLPELYGADIARTSLVANPGCYPTATILGLYAAVKNNLVHCDDLVVDAKSGATGAGRKAAVPTLFSEVSDNFRAYGLPTHRHTPEIEQEISLLAGQDVRLSFNTHLLPTNRGILATIYTRLKDPRMDLDAVRAVYTETWSHSPWVRILPKGALPETRYVRGSMFCDLGLVVDPRTGRLIILSAIDNLCRGASGQALANANLMCGLPVEAGLNNLAPLP